MLFHFCAQFGVSTISVIYVNWILCHRYRVDLFSLLYSRRNGVIWRPSTQWYRTEFRA